MIVFHSYFGNVLDPIAHATIGGALSVLPPKGDGRGVYVTNPRYQVYPVGLGFIEVDRRSIQTYEYTGVSNWYIVSLISGFVSSMTR